MYTNRNVVKIVASALLMVSLPAGAQVLGGNLGGAANGTFGGTVGRTTDIYGAARGTGNANIDASGPAGAMRERADNIGGKTREVGAGAAGTARSRVDSTRGAADATAHTAHSVGVDASRRTVDSAARARSSAAQNAAAQSNVHPGVQPNGGLLANGSGAAATEQHAMGRSVSAESAADWEASGDRSELRGSAASQTDVSVKKEKPAQ
jgi:hypothetical protein